MSVRTNRSREYTSSMTIWQRCRDTRAGEDAVKGRGEAYLSRLGGQTDDEYDAYKDRGRFYNAFNKTIDGFVGLAIRKPIQIEVAESFEPIEDDIDRQGSDIQSYFKSALGEVLTTGRGGTLVDYDQVDSAATLQQTINARPYWIQYLAEDIVDWEYDEGVLVYIVLRERISERGESNNIDGEYRYRECVIEDGVYVQRLWENEVDQPADIIPKLNGQSLTYIPFVIHQADFEIEVAAPPLLDLVNLCLSWYKLKADHMHALHYVALPTPYIIGVDEDSGPNTIGPQKIWKISNDQASVGLLEFTGAGLESVEKELKSMEDQMAVLGARILLPEVSENTATASTLRSISETSDLASIVRVLEKQFNQLLDFTVMWANVSGESSVTIDKNFIPRELDAGMVTALVSAWQNSAFDYETLVTNFKRAEIIPEEKDVEELEANIQAEEDERAEKAATAMSLLTSAESGDDDDEDEDDGS